VDSSEKPGQDSAGPIYERILVCYDGSDNATRALRRAINLAKESGAELSVIAAASTVSSTVGNPYRDKYYTGLRNVSLAHAKGQLSDAIQTARRAGLLSAQGKVEEGHPADVILTRAIDITADLIVVGRRGLGGVQRFLLGSVSSAVVTHSECDVLVVK